MKSILILAVLLAASCEGQYQREKNGCVGVNQYLCGDVCAKTGSTCTCGQGTFLVGYSEDSEVKVRPVIPPVPSFVDDLMSADSPTDDKKQDAIQLGSRRQDSAA